MEKVDIFYVNRNFLSKFKYVAEIAHWFRNLNPRAFLTVILVSKFQGGNEPLKGRVRLIEPSGFTKISALGIGEQRVNAIIDIISPVEKWRGLEDGFQ